MNMNEENFAWKVRHALNEKLDDLPDSVTRRLEEARRKALARKKPEAGAVVSVFQRVFAGAGNHSSGGMSWAAKLGISLPVLILAAGMAGIFHHEQQRHIREMADIDIAVLSDELPPSAYADSGFSTYMSDSDSSGA